jgi:tetratricopeptide (TPR) repeat protein
MKGQTMAPDELYRYGSPAVVRVLVKDAQRKPLGFGSGFFVSNDGLVVTNYHVIEGANAASVYADGATEVPVDCVVASDPNYDLVLLRVRAQPKQYLAVSDEAPPAVGSKVYAIGCPEGLTNTLNEGLVSALRGTRDGVPIIQTTAAISHGSSGGPLLSADGRVVGVTSAGLRDGQNLNFAVPAERVRSLLKMKPMAMSITAAAGDASTFLARANEYWNKGQEEEAVEAFETVVRMDPTGKDGTAARKALVHVYLDVIGARHLVARRYDLALAAFKSVIVLDSANPQAHAGIARSYSGLKRHPDAIKAAGAAIALSPRDPDLQVLLGDTYTAAGRYDEAKTAYFAALQLNPNSTHAYYAMGVSSKKRGQTADALKWWRCAMRLDAGGKDTWCSLARQETAKLQGQGGK